MGNYLGYALKAGVQGFQSGFNMAQKKTEMDWQKKQKKKLEQKEAELMEASSIFNSMVATAGEDGFYSDDEKMRINTAYMALAYEVKGRVDGTYKAIQAMDQKTTEENYQWFDYLREGVEGLDAKNVEALFDFVEPNITGEKGLQIFEALKNIETKKAGIQKEVTPHEFYEGSPAVVQTGIAESVAGQTPGLEGVEFKEQAPEVKAPSVAEKKYDWAIENYKSGKINFDQLSKFMGTDIGTGKDLTAKQQEVELMKQYGATTEEIKNKLLGTGEAKTTPEGEISAGEKRTFDMASSVMFGSSDWVTGISKPGIISMDISNKLNMGQKLTEEENTEIRNNYNAIKDTLPDEINKVIESQLKRYGISLEAPPEPEVLLDIKKKSFLQSDKKYYEGLSVEELYQLADKEDDKKAYEELKRRGKIK